MKSLKTLFDAGDTGAAAQMQQRLNPLFRALFVESNPIPLKAALWLLGIMRNELRLPLVPAQRSTIQLMQKVLSNLGLEVRSDVGGPT
jgi:4-hydroxy-tetrahydrodipicolinate synthase